MSSEQLSRDQKFFYARSIARALLEKGLIDEQQFQRLMAEFTTEYRPVIGALYA